MALWHDLNSGACRPARALAFIVDKPVKRDIFAAEFRDRVDRFIRRCSRNVRPRRAAKPGRPPALTSVPRVESGASTGTKKRAILNQARAPTLG